MKAVLSEGEVLVGLYQIIGEIGKGGAGVVYLAEHLRLRKKIVVKKMKDNFKAQINGKAEVDILKRLKNKCLPQVYDCLSIGNSLYIVMDYIEGHDLQYYLDRKYQFSEPLLIHWLSQLCEVLEYLHSKENRILHSDIKPANIMITKNNDTCLIDFNISIDGENTKDIQGISPWYAAPEQYEKAQDLLNGRKSKIHLDGRMDIYSLGAVFYRLMTGILPSPDKKIPDIMEMEIPYSEGFKAIISKAIKKNPSARFRTAGQMSHMIDNVVEMDPIYRRYGYMQAGGIFLWIILVIAGSLMVYYGNWQNNVEKWNQAYRKLYVSAETQNDTEIISQATEILNDFHYKSYMKQHGNQKAEVLHVLGDSYFRQENFREAARYYQEAWEIHPNQEGYYRDYMIALIRSGQNSKARQVMESGSILSEAELYLVQAETAWAGKDSKEALSAIENITESETSRADKEVLGRAYQLAAEVYVYDGNYGQALKMLESAEEIKPSRDILRETGQVAAEAAAAEENEMVQNTYLRKAFECYQSLNQSRSPSYEDRMNLALTKRALEDYEGSNSVLEGMLRDYPKDYKIPMWMCCNYLDLAAGNSDKKDIYEEIRYRYEDCKYLYRESGKKDTDMEKLIEVMEETGE